MGEPIYHSERAQLYGPPRAQGSAKYHLGKSAADERAAHVLIGLSQLCLSSTPLILLISSHRTFSHRIPCLLKPPSVSSFQSAPTSAEVALLKQWYWEHPIIMWTS